MKPFYATALLLLICLSARPSNVSAQAVAPLQPLVVTLEVGTVTTRKLIGIDSAAYQGLRARRASDQQLIAGLSSELAKQRKLMAHDSVTAAGMARALADCRQGWAGTTAALNAQEVRTAKVLALPSQKPLLLDPNTYKGAGALAVLATLFKVFIIH